MATHGQDARQLTARLTDLQARLDQARAHRSELQGELRSLIKQLKQGYGVDTLEAAEQLLEDLSERITGLEQTLADRLDEADAALAEAPQ